MKHRPPPEGQIVVISGAGSGIGKHTALRLSGLGYTVVAGVRSEEQAAGLQAVRVVPARFDVTSDADIADAVTSVRDLLRTGQTLRGVFSNAGMDSRSPDLSAEGTSMQAMQQLLDVNFLGAVRFIRGFLSLLRESRGTVIVNSALMARIVVPFNGGYAPSKAALESWAVALRREVAPQGVKVVLLELGGISTPLTRHDGPPQAPNPLYPQQIAVTKRLSNMAAQGAKSPAMSPDRAADLVARALATDRPRLRYLGGGGAHVLAAVAALPQRAQDALIAVALRRG